MLEEPDFTIEDALILKVANCLFDDGNVERLVNVNYREVLDRLITGKEDVVTFAIQITEEDLSGSAFGSPSRSSFVKRKSIQGMGTRRLSRKQSLSRRPVRSPSISNFGQVESITAISGLPLETDTVTRCCYLLHRSSSSSSSSSTQSSLSLEDISVGVFSGSALRHFSKLLKEFSPESAAVLTAASSLKSLAIAEAASVHLPQPNYMSLQSGTMSTLFVQKWSGVLQDLMNTSVPGPQTTSDEGPHAEIDIWKSCPPRLSSVLRQTNQPAFKDTFKRASPESINNWSLIEASAQATIKEARAVTRNLETLKQLLAPLYGLDSGQVLCSLPGLLQNMMLLRNLGSHYDKPANTTRLLARVTAQFIAHMKNKILKLATLGVTTSPSESGSLWELADRDGGLSVILDWCKSCMRDSLKYQSILAKQLQNESEFPIVPIISRLELFCKRVDKLNEVFAAFNQFDMLSSRHIPGASSLVERFHSIIVQLRASGADLLEHTAPAFDKASVAFKQSLNEVETSLKVFVNNAFERVTDVPSASILLRKFSVTLRSSDLRSEVGKKHSLIIEHFIADIHRTHTLFESQKKKPPKFRNSLPVASAVGWARLLVRRLEHSANILLRDPPEHTGYRLAKKAITLYNNIARGLVDYENIWLLAWEKMVMKHLPELHSTPIVHAVVKQQCLTFDVISDETARVTIESKQLLSLGVKLSKDVECILKSAPGTHRHRIVLKGILEEYNKTILGIPTYLRSITEPLIEKLHTAIHPATHGPLTWVSAGISDFISLIDSSVYNIIDTLKYIRRLTTDWMSFVLTSTSNILLLDLSKAPYSPDDFIRSQQLFSKGRPEELSKWYTAVERGCLLVISMFPEGTESAARELLCHFQRHFCKEAVAATIRSLKLLRRMVSPHCNSEASFLTVSTGDPSLQIKPLFTLSIILGHNGPEVQPSLSVVQEAVNDCGAQIIQTSQSLNPWESLPEASVFDAVTTNKEVIKTMFTITTAIHQHCPTSEKQRKRVSSSVMLIKKERAKDRLSRYLDRYKTKFEHLWNSMLCDVNPESLLQGDPLDCYEESIQKLVATVQSIQNDIPVTHVIAPFLLDFSPFKESLVEITQQKITAYLRPLHEHGKYLLKEICALFGDYERRLRMENTADTLHDMGLLVKVLKEVRTTSAEVELIILPIEDLYKTLLMYDYSIPSTEENLVADLWYRWKKLLRMSRQTQDYVNRIQSFHQRDLLLDIQRFGVEVIVYSNNYNYFMLSVDSMHPQDILERLKKSQRILDDMVARAQSQYEGAQLFAIPFKKCAILESCRRDFKLQLRVYSLRIKVSDEEEAMTSLAWKDLSLPSLTAVVNDLANQFKCLPVLNSTKAYCEVRGIISNMQHYLPLFRLLHQPCIHTRHWNKLMTLCGHQWSLSPETFRIHNLISADLLQVKEGLEELVLCANKEANIESCLQRVTEQWKTRKLEFTKHPKGNGSILKVDDTLTVKDALEEAQIQLVSLLSSRHIDAFKEEAQHWMMQLATTSETLTSWLEVQGAWMHIEAVFSGGSIAKQMPHEVRRFAMIDQQWAKIITRAKASSSVVQFCSGNDLTVLPGLAEQLAECQRRLSVYLEQKRGIFPRLYFVSESVLLEILAQASQPACLGSFLPSIFSGITGVVVTEGDDPQIIKLETAEGRPMFLKNPVCCGGNVEEWLNTLRTAIQETVHESLRNAALELSVLNPTDKVDATLLISDDKPTQISVLMLYLLWTADVSAALSAPRGEQRRSANDCTKRLREVMSSLLESKKPSTTRQEQLSLDSLLVCLVYLSDLWTTLNIARVTRDAIYTLWDWVRLVRVHWKSDGNTCVIRNVDSELQYGFEYLGHKEQLVATPLTDRCYMTMFQAITLHLGGAAVGPAGTGKTETIKELGRICGRLVVVFNCSDIMDSRGTATIFRGLVQSGDWGCFDEFNRIPSSVLSVLASQLTAIFSGLKRRVSEFMFTDGRLCKLTGAVATFATLNPTDTQLLPQNLKMLFRTVAMTIPDCRIIIKTKLAAVGFREPAVLARRFDVLYKLASWQLSQQHHYDFGLRSILSVLRTLAFVGVKDSSQEAQQQQPQSAVLGPPVFGIRRNRSFLSSSPVFSPNVEQQSCQSEENILVAVLLNINLPRLVEEDTEPFKALVQLVFPNCNANRQPREAGLVCNALEEKCQQMKLSPADGWLRKAAQLYTTKIARHGVLLAGPAGSGKTKLLEVLLSALTTSKIEIRNREIRLNPRTLTSQQMFGNLNTVTGEWNKGIFSTIWKYANNQKLLKSQVTWIILDGPIGQDWVENLNTVLDDNKILTLPNGDRLTMLDTTRILFEVEEMMNCTPATVSRLGIVFLSADDLPWRDLLQSIFSTYESSEAEGITPEAASQGLLLFYEHAENIWNIVSEDPTTVMLSISIKTVVAQAVTFYCNAVQGLLCSNVSISAFTTSFWYSICTVMGSMCSHDTQQVIDAYQKENRTQMGVISDSESCSDWGSSETEVISIFSSKLDISTGHLIPLESCCVGDKLSLCGNFIATPEGHSSIVFTKNCLKSGMPVLMIGDRGCGKSTIMKHCLSQISLEKNNNGSVGKRYHALSPSLSTTQTQMMIESNLVKTMGSTYAPRNSSKLFILLDDMSAPEPNNFGDNPSLEVIRQLLEFNGLWSLSRSGDYKTLSGIFWAAAMDATLAIYNKFPQRLLRYFIVVQYDLSVSRLRNVLPLVSPNLPEKLLAMTTSLWHRCSTTLLPSLNRSHLLWNVRDVFRVIQGLQMSCSGSSENQLIHLWKHECQCVFSDRLNIPKDVQTFSELLGDVTMEFLSNRHHLDSRTFYFKDCLSDATVDASTGDISSGRANYVNYSMFTHMQLVRKVQHAKQLLSEQMMYSDYSDIVLFDEIIQHIARVARILSLDNGSLILVGSKGVGRRSLIYLTSYMCGYPCHELVCRGGLNGSKAVISTVGGATDAQSIEESLRHIIKASGLEGPQTLLFKDEGSSPTACESFLESACLVLDTGEIPALFSAEDIFSMKHDLATLSKDETTSEALWNLFISNVHKNLHVILCMDPSTVSSARFIHKYKSLLSNCVVDWCHPWSPQGLQTIASNLLSDTKFASEENVSAVSRERIYSAAGEIHQRLDHLADEFERQEMKRAYFTLRTYKCFIRLFSSTFSDRHKGISEYAAKAKSGLMKLKETASDVSKIKLMVTLKEEKLKEAQQQQATLRAEMYESTAEAETKKRQANEQREAFSDEATKVAIARKDAVADLNVAQPALESAKRVLDAITSQDVKTIRTMSNPPAVIRRIIDTVSILMNLPVSEVKAEIDNKGRIFIADSWHYSGRALAHRLDFMQMIHEFNSTKKDWINQETLEIMLPYLALEDFSYERAKKACGNVAGLCTWARTMYNYYWVARDVEPKMQKVREAEAKMRAANSKLERSQEAFDKLAAEVSRCEEKLEEQRQLQYSLERDATNLRRTTEAANTLIEGLSSEKERWIHMSRTFSDSLNQTPMTCLRTATALGYSGPFDAHFRSKIDLLLEEVCGEEVSRETVWTAVQQQATSTEASPDWIAQGLPNDKHSIANAEIVINLLKYRYSYLIDPQSQGVSWLKERGKSKNITIIKTTDDRELLDSVALCMTEGRPCLIQSSSRPTMTSPLKLILQRGYRKSGRSPQVNLEGKLIEVAEGFELYFSSKDPFVQLTREFQSLVSVVNFEVTRLGLQEQLLSRTLQWERPELEIEMTNLNKILADGEHNLRELEERLLENVTHTGTAIIEDDNLISTLAAIKSAVTDVKDRLSNAHNTRNKIQNAREEYRPLAIRGNLLYTLALDMAKVNPIYGTSLHRILYLFDKSIKKSEHSEVPSRRVAFISHTLTLEVYTHYARGILEEHKGLFSLILACQISLENGQMTPDSFNCLLCGSSSMPNGRTKPALLTWLPNAAWSNSVAAANASHALRGLPAILELNREEWRPWYESDKPELTPLPPSIDGTISHCDHLLLVRCLREDRTICATQQFVCKVLGESYSTLPEVHIPDVICEATPLTPLLFFLNGDSDPLSSLDGISKRFKQKCTIVHLGSDQQHIAWEVAKDTIHSGGWIVLQNAHFGLSFLELLEAFYESLIVDCTEAGDQVIRYADESLTIPPEARVFITTEIVEGLPQWLIQRSFKLSGGLLVGVRGTMKKSLECLSSDMVTSFRRVEYRTLLYSLCMIHSLLQNRSRFGSLGWSRPYSFDTSDITSVAAFLQSHFSVIGDSAFRQRPVNFNCVATVVTDVFFGGSVSEECDRRIVKAQVNQSFQQLKSIPVTDVTTEIEIAPGGYTVSWDIDLYAIRTKIHSLPLNDNPKTFGIHSGTDVTRSLDLFLNNLLLLTANSRSETVKDPLNITENILLDIPYEETKKLLQTLQNCKWPSGPGSPMQMCLMQEVRVFHSHIKFVTHSLQAITRGLKGEILLGLEHRTHLEYLYRSEVPPKWVEMKSRKRRTVTIVAQWLCAIQGRYQLLNKWIGSKDGCLRSIPLNFIINPKGCLGAVLQIIATRENKPLDNIRIAYEFTSYMNEADLDPDDQFYYLSGLVLDAVDWSVPLQKLTNAVPKETQPFPLIRMAAEDGDMFYEAPVAVAAPVQTLPLTRDRKIAVTKSYFRCPCYTSRERGDANLVVEIPMESSHPDAMILRGAALFAE